MTTPLRIGLIGFGEVGEVFGSALRVNGAIVAAHDVMADDPQIGEGLARRANRAGIPLISLEKAVSEMELVLVAVPGRSSLTVAKQSVGFLTGSTAYVDMCTVGPSTKRSVQALVEASGATFTEGAILGAVGATGPSTRILLAGPAADEVARLLRQYGLAAEDYSRQVGTASTFKLLRSIFSKGIEALLIELLTAGHRAGIAGDVWEDIASFMDSRPFDSLASNWLMTHASANRRRYEEIREVQDLLSDLGIPPTMTEGTSAIFERSTSIDFPSADHHLKVGWEDIITSISESIPMRKDRQEGGGED